MGRRENDAHAAAGDDLPQRRRIKADRRARTAVAALPHVPTETAAPDTSHLHDCWSDSLRIARQNRQYAADKGVKFAHIAAQKLFGRWDRDLSIVGD